MQPFLFSFFFVLVFSPTVTLKCGGDPFSTHYKSFHVFKSTLTTSNTISKGVYKTFKLHCYKEKGVSKFQVAHFIFACLSLPNTKLTVFVCCPSVAV